MVSTTCRLCENAGIPDPTVAEITAHQRHPHPKRKANPYLCPLGDSRHKGQLHDPIHLCRPHRQQIEGAPALPEAAMSIPAGRGSTGDPGFDLPLLPAMEVLPSFGFEGETEAVERQNLLPERQ